MRLCLVTDRQFLGERSLVDIVAQAIRGGVDMVQLREKNLDARTWLDLAREVAQLCRKSKVFFIVNDRVDIAAASGADGVHLGQEDFPVALARKILGNQKIIGKSTHSLEQAKEAIKEKVDYVAVGPVFWTQTKKIDRPVGTELVAQVRKLTRKPILAIGGIQPENAAAVIAAGATGVAVVSALMAAPDAAEAASRLKKVFP
ncbi:MAG: thiamine phosphate synthase [candidate division Zixibacteria bacterium]|nr:thiamine phosphate synthase [candidate division Zixibacteria bacterium]MCI0595802.1 thiamine phosphate synthase [candidate division Zixibacteria bacterium]